MEIAIFLTALGSFLNALVAIAYGMWCLHENRKEREINGRD